MTTAAIVTAITRILVAGTFLVWGVWDMWVFVNFGGNATESVFIGWLLEIPGLGHILSFAGLGLYVHWCVLAYCDKPHVSVSYMLSIVAAGVLGAVVLGIWTWIRAS